MKKLLLVLLILLLAQTADAGRLFNANFEGITDQRETDSATGCTVSFATPPVPMMQEKAAKLQVINNVASGQNYARIWYGRNSGAVRDIVYIRGLIYVETDGITDGKHANIFSIERVGYTHNADVFIYKSGVQLQLVFRYYTNGDYSFSTPFNISTGTLYEVEYKYDRTNTAWEFRVNGATVDSGALTGDLGTGPVMIQAGLGDDYDDSATTTVWVDSVAWATDTWVESSSSLLINETFEDADFAITAEPNCTLDPDVSIPGTPPKGAGLLSLKAIVQNNSNNNAHATVDLGQDKSIVYVRGYIYLSSEGLNDNQGFETLVTLDSSNNTVARVDILQVSGEGRARFTYYSGGTLVSTVGIVVSSETWYRIEYRYDVTNLAWEWRIDGVTQHSGSLTAATKTPRKFIAGIRDNTGAGSSTFYTDLFAADDTEWIGTEEKVGGVGVGVGISSTF